MLGVTGPLLQAFGLTATDATVAGVSLLGAPLFIRAARRERLAKHAKGGSGARIGMGRGVSS
jgi:hypothetical protein